MKYDSALCTLNEVVEQLRLDGTADVSLTAAQQTIITTEDANKLAYLKRLITGVSGVIENDQNRTFIPYLDSMTHDRNYLRTSGNFSRLYDSYRLTVKDDLLSISSITWVGTAVASADYRLYDPDVHPNRHILIDANAVTTLPSDFDENVTVVGTWGYNRNPDDMWINTTTMNDAGGISASDTSVTVTSVANLSQYQYIQIEDEICFITDITGSVLTIERGARGSTAVTHADTTAVYRYRQHPEVSQVARRLVVRLLQNRAEVGDLIVVGEGAYKINSETIKLNLKKPLFMVI